ncbi:chlorophyll a-b binding domain-containing protein [Phormidium yuhuli AB48]|uniref:Chlorophyll a-b binding domain-containing protein n=1 Tax=Phormidium yuhuli AB48 TaxID=2940671 RepID=A0ABY5ALH1_9CYAN|nr:chlorophyll a/b-binding protein [Phormidium yuhuli]USR90059.1 chlorophyll a-b binding domain-containing protein [Phormidium yuhuli AB48]
MSDEQQTPQSAPQSEPDSQAESTETPSFGWNLYSEKINGRFAMIGFVALLVLEAVTGQTFLSWMGLL